MLAHVVKVSLPNYLQGLPIPDSFGGWFKLGFKDWMALVPPAAFTVGLYYVTYKAFCPSGSCDLKKAINPGIKKLTGKVVDSVDVEDIADKAAFCRCWRTQNWPYCDGSHGKHNTDAGDNVGPLVITNKKK